MRARLGAGGSPIEIKGVNGQVRFDSDVPATTTTTTSAVPSVGTSSPVAPVPNAPLLPAPPGY
jgi:hypothetical protein